MSSMCATSNYVRLHFEHIFIAKQNLIRRLHKLYENLRNRIRGAWKILDESSIFLDVFNAHFAFACIQFLFHNKLHFFSIAEEIINVNRNMKNNTSNYFNEIDTWNAVVRTIFN